MDESTDTTRETIPIRNKARTLKILQDLLEELRNTTIPPINSRKGIIGSIGRTITFGFGNTRRGFKEFSTNRRHPRLLKLLADFGNEVVPKGWEYNAITLNEGVKAKKHKDVLNIGRSVLIGIGDYEGGDVRVWDGEDKHPIVFDVKMNPVMFNGGLLYHQTTPFKGERYTIIYYKQKQEGTTKGVPMRGRGSQGDQGENHPIFG